VRHMCAPTHHGVQAPPSLFSCCVSARHVAGHVLLGCCAVSLAGVPTQRSRPAERVHLTSTGLNSQCLPSTAGALAPCFSPCALCVLVCLASPPCRQHPLVGVLAAGVRAPCRPPVRTWAGFAAPCSRGFRELLGACCPAAPGAETVQCTVLVLLVRSSLRSAHGCAQCCVACHLGAGTMGWLLK
jgi:hypothetical protein